MANTTFLGNVRENGDGLRTSIAGSMCATANFHIVNTLTAGDGNVQKSETDTTSVVLPKGAVVYQISIWDASGTGGATQDIGYTPVGTGTVVADPNGLAIAQPVTAKSLSVVGGATDGAALGGTSTIINAVEYGPAIVNAVGAREQLTVTHEANTSAAGSASGTLYYFVADEKNGAESN
jgi:hypothetical protein